MLSWQISGVSDALRVGPPFKAIFPAKRKQVKYFSKCSAKIQFFLPFCKSFSKKVLFFLLKKSILGSPMGSPVVRPQP